MVSCYVHTYNRGREGGRSPSAMSFVTREEASMLEAEQPEEQNREESDAKPKRSCLSTQHGGAVDGGGEGVWGV